MSREDVSWLLLKYCIVVPLFFSIAQLLGIAQFTASPPPWTLPSWAGFAIMIAFGVFSVAVPLRAMCDVSWRNAIQWAVVLFIVFNVLNAVLQISLWRIEVITMMLLPLYFGGKPWHSIPIFGGITIYVAVFILGARGYLVDGRFSPEWIVLSTLDYYVFIWLICINKFRIRKELDHAKERIISLGLYRTLVQKARKWKNRLFDKNGRGSA
jgi:hypothetical protein